MTSTHRAENIFHKYLLYYIHEIARKYPREKYRYSSFSDSVVEGCKAKEEFNYSILEVQATTARQIYRKNKIILLLFQKLLK
jgi:hypothetical protein